MRKAFRTANLQSPHDSGSGARSTAGGAAARNSLVRFGSTFRMSTLRRNLAGAPFPAEALCLSASRSSSSPVERPVLHQFKWLERALSLTAVLRRHLAPVRFIKELLGLTTKHVASPICLMILQTPIARPKTYFDGGSYIGSRQRVQHWVIPLLVLN